MTKKLISIAVILSLFIVKSYAQTDNRIRNAYETINAVDFSGVGDSWYPIIADMEKNCIMRCTFWSNVYYCNVNFGEGKPLKLSLNYAVDDAYGCILYIRKDSADGEVLAQIDVKANTTGGWYSFKTALSDVTKEISGIHDIYITFSGEGGPNIRSFRFIEDAPAEQTLLLTDSDADSLNDVIISTYGIDEPLSENAYACFNDVDFSDYQILQSFKFNITANGKGTLNIKLDSTENNPIATLKFNAGNDAICAFGDFKEYLLNIPSDADMSGIHDVYLCFEEDSFCAVKSIEFNLRKLKPMENCVYYESTVSKIINKAVIAKEAVNRGCYHIVCTYKKNKLIDVSVKQYNDNSSNQSYLDTIEIPMSEENSNSSVKAMLLDFNLTPLCNSMDN